MQNLAVSPDATGLSSLLSNASLVPVTWSLAEFDAARVCRRGFGSEEVVLPYYTPDHLGIVRNTAGIPQIANPHFALKGRAA